MHFSEALDPASRLLWFFLCWDFCDLVGIGGIFRIGRRGTRSWQPYSLVLFSCLHGYAKTSNSYHDVRPHKFAKPFSPESLQPARHSWEWMSAFKMSVTFSFRNVFHVHFLSARFRSSRRRFFTYILIYSIFRFLQYWYWHTLTPFWKRSFRIHFNDIHDTYVFGPNETQSFQKHCCTLCTKWHTFILKTLFEFFVLVFWCILSFFRLTKKR